MRMSACLLFFYFFFGKGGGGSGCFLLVGKWFRQQQRSLALEAGFNVYAILNVERSRAK